MDTTTAASTASIISAFTATTTTTTGAASIGELLLLEIIPSCWHKRSSHISWRLSLGLVSKRLFRWVSLMFTEFDNRLFRDLRGLQQHLASPYCLFKSIRKINHIDVSNLSLMLALGQDCVGVDHTMTDLTSLSLSAVDGTFCQPSLIRSFFQSPLTSISLDGVDESLLASALSELTGTFQRIESIRVESHSMSPGSFRMLLGALLHHSSSLTSLSLGFGPTSSHQNPSYSSLISTVFSPAFSTLTTVALGRTYSLSIPHPDRFFNGLAQLTNLESLRFYNIVDTTPAQFNGHFSNYLANNLLLTDLRPAFPVDTNILFLIPAMEHLTRLSITPIRLDIPFNQSLSRLSITLPDATRSNHLIADLLRCNGHLVLRRLAVRGLISNSLLVRLAARQPSLTHLSIQPNPSKPMVLLNGLINTRSLSTVKFFNSHSFERVEFLVLYLGTNSAIDDIVFDNYHPSSSSPPNHCGSFKRTAPSHPTLKYTRISFQA
eukprot:gene11416-13305_t